MVSPRCAFYITKITLNTLILLQCLQYAMFTSRKRYYEPISLNPVTIHVNTRLDFHFLVSALTLQLVKKNIRFIHLAVLSSTKLHDVSNVVTTLSALC